MKYRILKQLSLNPATFASAVMLFIVAVLMAPNAMALTVTDGANGITGYRWLIEEDKTYHVPLNVDGTVQGLPGAPTIDPNWEQPNTLSVSFSPQLYAGGGNGHKS